MVAVAFAVAAANPYMVRIFVNGLESGVLVVLDACLLAAAVACRGRFVTRASGRERLGVGVLLALIVLARTDSVLLVGALGLWSLAEARTLGRRALRPLLELFGIVAVVTVVYLVSNQLWFGVVIQISGLTKRAPLTVEPGAGDGSRGLRGRRDRRLGLPAQPGAETAGPARVGSGGPGRSRRPRPGSPRSAWSWWPTTRCCSPSSGSGTTARSRCTCCS